MKKTSLFILIAVISTSCGTNQLVSNGAYSDISLTRNSNEYDITRLKEITSEGKAIFGIPVDKKTGNKYGTVVRFNGVQLSGTKRIFPILSMVVLSAATGQAIQGLFGYKTETLRSGNYSYTYNTDYKIGLVPATIIGLPISGALNNLIWPESSMTRAFQKFNRQLVQDNPNTDVFLNPKYEITTKTGIWTSRTTVAGKVMGATIKTK
jgi:hypothetical protein